MHVKAKKVLHQNSREISVTHPSYFGKLTVDLNIKICFKHLNRYYNKIEAHYLFLISYEIIIVVHSNQNQIFKDSHLNSAEDKTAEV